MKNPIKGNPGRFFLSRRFILFIIAAGMGIFIISAAFNHFLSLEKKISIGIGESEKIHGTELTLEDFKITRNPDNTEKEYSSEIYVDGRSYHIRVNYPARLNSGFLYQWSYARSWEIELYFPEADFSYKGPDNSVLTLGPYSVRIGPFIPDFFVSDNKIITRSDVPLNPAVLIEYYENTILKARQWVFYKNPVKPEPGNFEMNCIMADFEEKLSSTLNYIESPADYGFLAAIILIAAGSFLLIIRNLLLLRHDSC